MELREMKKLESEVKGLQNLMREVHRNQVELNRVLLNRNVCSGTLSRPGSSALAEGGSAIAREQRPPDGRPVEPPQVPKFQQLTTQTKEKLPEGKTKLTPLLGSSKQDTEQLTEAEDSLVGTLKSEMKLVQQEMGCTPVGILSCSKVISQSSSFIRNILNEDCRAGVAVIDLFVMVKMAKDTLNCLSRSNSVAFDKINHLKKETVDIGNGYRDLVEEMRKLLCRMNELSPCPESLTQRKKLRSGIHLSGEMSKVWENIEERPDVEEGKKSRGSQTPSRSPSRDAGSAYSDLETATSEHVPSDCRSRTKSEESYSVECQRGETAREGSGSRGGCIGCFVSSHKAALFEELPQLSEASFTSFMETLFRMQKGKRSVCKICSSSLMDTLPGHPENKENEGTLNLSESAFRMFCDICEILDGAAREDLAYEQYLTETDEDPDSVPISTVNVRDRTPKVKSAADHPKGMSCLYPSADFSRNCLGRKSLRSARSAKCSKREVSESESEFEEATTTEAARPFSRLGLKVKPSVTCMGDLTRTVPGKKSASTLTTASSISSYRRLSSGIKSKVKRIISKKNVKIDELKPGRGSKKSSGKAGPSADATDKCRPYRVLAGPALTQKTTHSAFSSGPSATLAPSFPKPKGDDYLSEDSFHNCDSESAAAGSISGDDDLEEFVEIFNETSRPNENAAPQERGPIWRDDSQVHRDSFFGYLHKTTLKTIKALFFEIQKCYPAYFVQEILPKTVKSKPHAYDESISLNPGENKEKRVVIEGSSTDFVIYIQVELDEASCGGSSEFFVDHQASSLRTQTFKESPNNPHLQHPKLAKLPNCLVEEEEEEEDRQSFYDVWEECRPGELEERERITFDEPSEATANSEVEREIRDTYPEESLDEGKEGKVQTATAEILFMMDAKRHADVWLLQKTVYKSYVTEKREASIVTPKPDENASKKSLELEKALNLIHEIENDIADVKLGDAISILPRLEWELRRHLQSKIKGLGGKEPVSDVGNASLFPLIDFLPEEEVPEIGNSDASERMQNLLMMLTELELAIKSNDCSGKVGFCQYDPSKVYKLLRALVDSIRGLEGGASMASLSQTLEIASQLDTAVREYDSIVKKRPLDYLCPEDGRKLKRRVETWESVPAKQHLRNVRKKVFEIVEDEATQLEIRIEKGFMRLNLLEKENDEAMTFLEALLQKTKRRMSELTYLKDEVQKLATSITEVHQSLLEKVTKRQKEKEEQEVQLDVEKRSRVLPAPVTPPSPSAQVSRVPSVAQSNLEGEKEKPKEPSRPPSPKVLKETVSGLLNALDSLKSRAREKNEVCRELLCPSALDKLQVRESTTSARRSSRSSFTAKHSDTLTSTVKGFRKMGQDSLYLAWSSPEGSLKDLVTGYEIYLNGNLNQKVRNSRRLEALLYSVDFTKSLHLELYAIAENYPKMLMISQHYNSN